MDCIINPVVLWNTCQKTVEESKPWFVAFVEVIVTRQDSMMHLKTHDKVVLFHQGARGVAGKDLNTWTLIILNDLWWKIVLRFVKTKLLEKLCAKIVQVLKYPNNQTGKAGCKNLMHHWWSKQQVTCKIRVSLPFRWTMVRNTLHLYLHVLAHQADEHQTTLWNLWMANPYFNYPHWLSAIRFQIIELKYHSTHTDQCRRECLLSAYNSKPTTCVKHLCCDVCDKSCDCNNNCSKYQHPIFEFVSSDIASSDSSDSALMISQFNNLIHVCICIQ